MFPDADVRLALAAHGGRIERVASSPARRYFLYRLHRSFLLHLREFPGTRQLHSGRDAANVPAFPIASANACLVSPGAILSGGLLLVSRCLSAGGTPGHSARQADCRLDKKRRPRPRRAPCPSSGQRTDRRRPAIHRTALVTADERGVESRRPKLRSGLSTYW